jgi:parvulin-like peptidyl-prolyl isomerase
MNSSNMKVRIIFPTLLAAVLCAFTTAQAADTNAAASGNSVIARGNGFEIKRGELDDAMAGVNRVAASKGQTISPENALAVERQILNQMINNKLLLAKATDADRAAGTNAAKLHMTALLENLGSADELNKQLLIAGETPQEERSTFADRITAQTALFRELKVVVSDDDVKKFFDDHRISAFETPEMARISHILIFTVDPVTRAALSADQQQSQRKVAEDVFKNLRAGVDFLALAKQFSEDPGSKANGGELPPFPRGQMAPEIDAAAFSLTNNQVSSLITTSTGYEIIKVLERIPAQKTGYLAAAPKIKDFLTQQQAQKLAPPYLEGLRAAAGVEILDPNLKMIPTTASATPSSP